MQVSLLPLPQKKKEKEEKKIYRTALEMVTKM